VPFASPENPDWVAEAPAVTLAPPGEAVIVYPVTLWPPFEAGGVQVTAAPASDALACTDCGAPGTVNGVPDADGPAGPRPALFMAETPKV
jgi:hypothetical protein